MKNKHFAIIGAGFSGAVLANELAHFDCEIDVFESRDHVAGNCFTVRDQTSDILLHQYGPHIFHTDNDRVWNFVNNLSEFKPYINRVKITTKGHVYSLPINLHTINQFFNKIMNPEEAKNFIASISDKGIGDPETFEEQALKFVGRDLYEAFFKGYTIKQWGINPTELPASILKRLPLRFNYDDNYFNHKYQGMPIDGYTPLVEKLLDHHKIKLHLNNKFDKVNQKHFDHIFYTGPIDAWFAFDEGRLGYRTLDFEREDLKGDYQGCAVMNYGDQNTPYTRISEHKHFSPWESHEKTIIFKEFSRECTESDIPYYPIRLVNEKAMLSRYIAKAKEQKNISFLGRLGTYRYLDMDVTIREALEASDLVKKQLEKNSQIPTFFINPI